MELTIMSKTIQVRVDEHLKDSVDELFSSLGLDTSTAIRMFLVACMEADGIPFAVRKESWEERNERLAAAEAYRKAGGKYLTTEESLANMRAAMERGRAARSEAQWCVADGA